MPVPGAAPAISGPTPTPQTVAKVATVSTTPVTPSASGASASGITVKPSSNDKNKSAQTSHLEQIANKLISASTRKKLDQQSVAVTKLPDNDVAAQKPSLELSFSAISQSRLSLVWYIFQKYHVTYRTLANGVMFDDPPITVGSCAVHW